MEYTRITAKLFEPMWNNFNQQIDSLFLKRDAFLENVIKAELVALSEELKGKRLSKEAALFIARELNSMPGGTKTVSIQLTRETADELNKIVNETYIVRDAFLNRLIMFLRASDELLEKLGFPNKTSANSFIRPQDLPVSPLPAWQEIFNDPFYYIRSEIDKENQKAGTNYGLYTLELPDGLTGFECYIDDKYVPGTKAYLDLHKDLDLAI